MWESDRDSVLARERKKIEKETETARERQIAWERYMCLIISSAL